MRRLGGSPPLTRGRSARAAACWGREGLTPAYAGTMAIIDCHAHTVVAHPRLRGDDLPIYVHNLGYEGSPPLTRGRSGPPPGGTRGRWAHPRLRGDDRRRDTFGGIAGGSPPLTRGRYCENRSPTMDPHLRNPGFHSLWSRPRTKFDNPAEPYVSLSYRLRTILQRLPAYNFQDHHDY